MKKALIIIFMMFSLEKQPKLSVGVVNNIPACRATAHETTHKLIEGLPDYYCRWIDDCEFRCTERKLFDFWDDA